MKFKALYELIVVVLLVIITFMLGNLVESPLWIKYLANTAKIVVILVAPGYLVQGLFFSESSSNFFIIRLGIACILSIAIWISLAYLLDVFGIGINISNILWVYSILCIGLAGLALIKTEPNRRTVKPQSEIHGNSRQESGIGKILFISFEALMILGIVWLVGSIRTEAMSQGDYTEFYITKDVEIDYVSNEDSVDIFVPITIVNLESVEAEYGIVAEYNQEAVGVVGSIRLAPGESWNGIVEVNIKNNKQMAEINFLLAMGEESFPYRSLMLKFGNFMNEEDLDLDESNP